MKENFDNLCLFGTQKLFQLRFVRSRRCHDHMLVEFTTTYAFSAYHH